MKSTLLFILLIALWGCKKKKEEKLNYEIWVEASQRADTIKFDNPTGWMELRRGTEIINGYKLPKIHSGPYDYEIKGTSISLRWALSSSTNKNEYYFSMDANRKNMKIGNFYLDALDKNTIINFVRIK